MQITRITADAADTDLAGWHRVLAARWATDRPTEPPMTYQAAVGRLTTPAVGYGEVRHWVARDGGAVVAVATAHLTDEENPDIAITDVTVDPARRRAGIGSAVLARVLADHDRPITQAWGVARGGDGAGFAAALGMRTVCTTLYQRLALDEVDPARWAAPVADGYALRAWSDAAPEELLVSYARARTAIQDLPENGSAYEMPDWTPERVRAGEDESRARGVEHRVVAAVRGGEVVAMTEVHLYPHMPTRADQGETAVLGEHRGHGLGLAVKAGMLRWLRTERPGIARVYTGTDDDNVHMSRINLALGFETVQTLLAVEAATADLRARLG